MIDSVYFIYGVSPFPYTLQWIIAILATNKNPHKNIGLDCIDVGVQGCIH
jgi:hypothetical protein